MFNILKNMASLQKELAELNSKIEYQLTPVWTNPTYNIIRIGSVIYIDYYCIVNDGRGGNAYGIAKLPSEICPKHTIKTQAWSANTNSQRHGALDQTETYCL